MHLSVEVTPSSVEFDIWLLFVRKGSDECPMLTDDMWETMANKITEALWCCTAIEAVYGDNLHLQLKRRVDAAEQVCTLCDRPHDDTWNPTHAFAYEEQREDFEYLSVKYEEDLDEWKATLPAEVVSQLDKCNTATTTLELKLL